MSDKDFIKMNYEGLKKKDMAKPISGKYGIEAEKAFNEHLEKLAKTKDFNQKLFDKGVEYFNVGGSVENIPDELKNNRSFMTGYNHAARLAQIEKMDSHKSR